MQAKELAALCAVLAGISFIAASIGGLIVERSQSLRASNTLGSAMENAMNEIPTATNVNTGGDVSTLVVATNTARQYLRLTNNSTSSAQALYCNTNDRPAVKNSGFVVFASSTLEFDFDNLYRGALRCIFATGTSSVTVVEN